MLKTHDATGLVQETALIQIVLTDDCYQIMVNSESYLTFPVTEEVRAFQVADSLYEMFQLGFSTGLLAAYTAPTTVEEQLKKRSVLLP